MHMRPKDEAEMANSVDPDEEQSDSGLLSFLRPFNVFCGIEGSYLTLTMLSSYSYSEL